jgi:hypothetical protein
MSDSYFPTCFLSSTYPPITYFLMSRIAIVTVFVIILLVDCATFHNSRWMEQDMHILQNSSLPMITLPGTHQSGAYWFSQEVSPDISFGSRVQPDNSPFDSQVVQKPAFQDLRSIDGWNPLFRYQSL